MDPGTDPDDPADTGTLTEGEAGRRHVRGSVLLVVGRVLALVIGMATAVILVRALSKAEYGAFEYALTLAGAGRILLSLGQGRLLSRFMAGYEEEGDYPRMFGAMFLAVGTIFVTSIPIITALFVWSDALLGPVVEGGTAVRLVLVLLFVAPMEALDQVFVSLFAVFSKPRAIFVRKHLMAPGLRFLVVLVLWVTGQSVMFLAVGYLLASLAGLLLYVGLLVKLLRERGLWRAFDPRTVVLPFRAVFAFSVPLITGELALLSMKVGGVMVLALYHPLTEIADYRAVFGVARLNTAVTTSFATLFLPVIARLHARGLIDELRGSYWHTAGFVAVSTFPIFALTGPLAPATTVTLFGEPVCRRGAGAVDPRRGLLPERDVRLQRLHVAGVWPDPAAGRGEPVHGESQHRTVLRPGGGAGGRRHRTGELCRAHQPEPHQPVGAARRDPHRFRAS